jgi:rhodanese-related sulfurtransferase
MAEILRDYPSAQRALFQRYHIGGCSSCGFQPTDLLEQVCRDHNILDVNEVIHHIQHSHEVDQRMQVPAREVKRWLDAGESFRFIDVRFPEELALARLSQAEPLDFANSAAYMQLPRETKIVFLCKSGARSLDVAAYFRGHGFTQVFSLHSGLDGWRAEVDPSLADY